MGVADGVATGVAEAAAIGGPDPLGLGVTGRASGVHALLMTSSAASPLRIMQAAYRRGSVTSINELDALPPPWSTVFELMWEAYLAGTIPVGAVVADDQGAIVSSARNRIFTAALDAQIGGSRLGHAEINALVALSSERHYPELTVYASLEPCHLCLAGAIMSRVGGLRYAGADPYAGAVGKLLPNAFLEQYPLRVEGPLPGLAGHFPELLHVRHMLWRVPEGKGLVPFYRRTRPEVVELALRIPAPPEATSLEDAVARVAG